MVPRTEGPELGRGRLPAKPLSWGPARLPSPLLAVKARTFQGAIARGLSDLPGGVNLRASNVNGNLLLNK